MTSQKLSSNGHLEEVQTASVVEIVYMLHGFKVNLVILNSVY